MNERRVSPARLQEAENRLIFFHPPDKCDYCDRLTSVALTNASIFEPVCPLHGFSAAHSSHPTPRELADQLKTIERFLVWMHGDRGCLVLITVIQAEKIPGYVAETFEPTTMFADQAWYVCYEASGGERTDLYVLWSVPWTQFSLYRDGQLVRKRESENVA
jgi:hypothetical protein